MTDNKWEAVALLIEESFKGEFSDEKRGAYRTFLDKFEAEEVMAALHRLVESGSAFLPAVPEIVQAVRAIQTEESGGEVPGWAEAYRALHRALSVRVSYFASEEEKTAAAVAWLERHSHAMVARFFEVQGFRRLSEMGLDDPDYGHLRQRDLERAWVEFVEVARDRLASGLALKAVGRRPALTGPRRLDQAALLETAGLARPKELDAGG